MTAIRIIDNHFELTNIGELIHEEIDLILSGSTFLLVSGTASSGFLSGSRVLTVGEGTVITDSGGSLKIAAPVTVWNEVPAGSLDGTNTAFSLANLPFQAGGMIVSLNGVVQRQGGADDYFVVGDTVFFNTGSQPDAPTDNLLVTYQRAPV